MVAGRLDYCNAVLYGSSYMNIDKLQRVQNTLARVVSKTHRRDHITPVLADLHWLPVRYRIEYKIALLTYKALTISNRSICQNSFVSARLQDVYDLAVPTSCSTVQQFSTDLYTTSDTLQPYPRSCNVNGCLAECEES